MPNAAQATLIATLCYAAAAWAISRRRDGQSVRQITLPQYESWRQTRLPKEYQESCTHEPRLAVNFVTGYRAVVHLRAKELVALYFPVRNVSGPGASKQLSAPRCIACKTVLRGSTGTTTIAIRSESGTECLGTERQLRPRTISTRRATTRVLALATLSRQYRQTVVHSFQAESDRDGNKGNRNRRGQFG